MATRARHLCSHERPGRAGWPGRVLHGSPKTGGNRGNGGNRSLIYMNLLYIYRERGSALAFNRWELGGNQVGTVPNGPLYPLRRDQPRGGAVKTMAARSIGPAFGHTFFVRKFPDCVFSGAPAGQIIPARGQNPARVWPHPPVRLGQGIEKGSE